MLVDWVWILPEKQGNRKSVPLTALDCFVDGFHSKSILWKGSGLCGLHLEANRDMTNNFFYYQTIRALLFAASQECHQYTLAARTFGHTSSAIPIAFWVLA